MKTKTADLIGPALDWAVAKCEGVPLVYRGRKWPTDGAATIEYAPWSVNPVVNGAGPYVASLCREQYSPSVDWAQGGPLIERENIGLEKHRLDGLYQWAACDWHPVVVQGYTCLERSKYVYGPTPLIAAMRCLVAATLGDEVDVPDELV